VRRFAVTLRFFDIFDKKNQEPARLEGKTILKARSEKPLSFLGRKQHQKPFFDVVFYLRRNDGLKEIICTIHLSLSLKACHIIAVSLLSITHRTELWNYY